jgi:hypothetical protein
VTALQLQPEAAAAGGGDMNNNNNGSAAAVVCQIIWIFVTLSG